MNELNDHVKHHAAVSCAAETAASELRSTLSTIRADLAALQKSKQKLEDNLEAKQLEVTRVEAGYEGPSIETLLRSLSCTICETVINR